METASLQSLLREVSHFVQSDLQHREERRKRGELFNVFDVLGLRTNEMRTHSAFIKELLDPMGNHGLGDRFLQAFIQNVECLQELYLDTPHAKVQTEKHIGFKNDDCTEGGQIDIVIEAGNKAIFIENKIYAGDQENQLLRYSNFGSSNYAESRLLYLTLFKNDASEQSASGLRANEDYIPIGYNTEILAWLERCIELSVSHPIVRETIVQYRNLIKDLTFMNMETKYSDNIIEAMTKPENVDAVVAILGLGYDWENHIVKKYVEEPLAEFAHSNNLVFEFSDGIYNRKKESGFYFHKPEWNNAAIYFYTECNNWQKFHKGVSNYSGNKLDVQQQKLDCLNGAPTDYWPYGWEFLDQFGNWSRNTMPDMINGKVAEYIKESVLTMLAEIEDKGLKMP